MTEHLFVGGSQDGHPEKCDVCDVDYVEHWKPVALDLFCGKGGWTNALLAMGFKVYGFDIEPQPDYKGIFVQCDILAMGVSDFREYGAIFATCSSPCEEFSVHGMAHFHPNPKYPEFGIRLFNHARFLLEGLEVPYVMENVRPAQKFIGRSVNHCGPFHLWGTAVPALFPKDAYKVSKGIDVGSSKAIKGMTKEEKSVYRSQFVWNQAWSSSTERQRDTAQAAMIPELVAREVAKVARSIADDMYRQKVKQ